MDNDLTIIDSLLIEKHENYFCIPFQISRLSEDSLLISGIAYDSIINDMQLYLLWINEELQVLKDSLYGDNFDLDFLGYSIINYSNNIVLNSVINPGWIENSFSKSDEKYLWEIDHEGNTINLTMDTLDSQGFGLVQLGSSGKYHYTGLHSLSRLNSDFSIDTIFDFDIENFSFWYTKHYAEGEYLAIGQQFIGINPINPLIPDFDIKLLRLDSSANILNSSVFGVIDTNDRVGDIDFYYHDTVFIGGTKHVMNDPVDNWIEVFKTDLSGQKFFEFYYGGYGKYWLTDVLATKDGGCVVTGTWWDFYNYPNNYDQNDAFIMKIGPDGIVTNMHNMQRLENSPNVLIYPNPGGDVLSVSSKLSNLYLRLFDQSGRFIMKKNFNQETTINTSNLETGTYIYFIYQDKKQVKSGKWIKTN